MSFWSSHFLNEIALKSDQWMNAQKINGRKDPPTVLQ